MALDAAVRDRLWNSRYRQELEQVARKNAYLNDDGSAEDLFGDLSINVWIKAVNDFDASRVTYTGDLEKAFNAFFHWKLKNELANLAEHRQTVSQTDIREKTVRGDQPVGGDDEGEGTSLFELLEGGRPGDVATNLDFKQLLHSLPPDVGGALEYLIEHLEPGNQTEVWNQVREQFGYTKNRLYNALMSEPEFVDFVTE